jgi:hypothetical protein
MRYKETKTFKSGERRPTKVGTTVPQVVNSSAGSLLDNLADEAGALDHSSQNLVVAVRDWIRTNLDKMRTFLARMSLSNLQPGRTRWGPPWQWKRIEDEGPPEDELSHEKEAGLERVLEQARKRATELLADKTKHAPSRKGPARSRSKTSNGLGISATRGNASRLRSPRSETTRALCLLNRLRAHAQTSVDSKAINEEYGGRKSAHRNQTVYGSSNVRIQRWVGCLPMGNTTGSGRRHEYLSPTLTPITEGG